MSEQQHEPLTTLLGRQCCRICWRLGMAVDDVLWPCEVARLTAQLAARDAEVARLREHVLDAADCLDRVMGPRRPMTLPRKDEMRMAMDALRAALTAPTSGEEG